MDAPIGPSAISATDATDYLHYASQVRKVVRRAAGMPVFAHVILGLLLLSRGLEMRYLPHLAPVPTIWLFGLAMLRPAAAAWGSTGDAVHAGVFPGLWMRSLPALAAVWGAGTAVMFGGDALISAVAAGLATSAWLMELRLIAIATAAAGLIGNVLMLQGAPPGMALTAFGFGLVGVALARRHAW